MYTYIVRISAVGRSQTFTCTLLLGNKYKIYKHLLSNPTERRRTQWVNIVLYEIIVRFLNKRHHITTDHTDTTPHPAPSPSEPSTTADILRRLPFLPSLFIRETRTTAALCVCMARDLNRTRHSCVALRARKWLMRSNMLQTTWAEWGLRHGAYIYIYI